MTRSKARYLILIPLLIAAGAFLLLHFSDRNNKGTANGQILKDSIKMNDEFFGRRDSMVKEQLQARGISNRLVLDAMLSVKRHLFVPERYRPYAYADGPLPIGLDQTISQPYIVAYMTEAVEPAPEMKVLEIGTGSGYQAAVLAEIVKEVYTIEYFDDLARNAAKLLDTLGYDNVKVKAGDGFFGWKEYAPFDAIIVTAAPEDVPQPLIEQLKEGGRMIIPLGGSGTIQSLVILQKVNGKIERREAMKVKFVPFLRK
ncbi:MAG: protein-L-isoaspartate O-methyltransferase [Ignavibacteriaceae bacterium]|nr:MAG: protein-L-isoaspartate O-methyltransferase [Ignavibacteriaceae bacterium]